MRLPSLCTRTQAAIKPIPIPPGQIEVEHREETELEKNAKMLRGDLLKLNTLLSKNGQLSLALQQQNALMETDFLHRLKARHGCLFHFLNLFFSAV